MAIWNHVRIGVRMLRKSPGFAATAVLTMALGIGATTAIFSVADAMLWKPLPVPHLDSLAMVMERRAEDPHDFSYLSPADFADIQRQAGSLQSLTAWTDGMANIVGAGGEPERVIQFLVSANFFDVIGVRMPLGRGFAPGEDEPGREREVVLSDTLWRTRFGGDPAIVGKTIRLDDENFQVTGVAPPNFSFPRAAELWTPLAASPAVRNSRRGSEWLAAGHLKPGRTLAQLSAELDGIGKRLAEQYPATNRDKRFMTWDASRFIVGEFSRQYVLMLLGSVMFVLLIACVNVANLQFARATGRLREVAVRTALGASRGQIGAQLVTESVMLSVAGAALGLLIANWGIHMIRAGMPAEVEKYIAGWSSMSLDSRALLFTLIAAVASGILAGLTPAWQCSRPNLSAALKEGGRTSAGKSRHRLRNILVGAEVALAVVLLVGASLMVRGFGALVNASTSIEPASLLTLRLALTETKYREPHQRTAFYREVLDRAATIPGVKSAVAVSALPYSDHSSGRAFTIEGKVSGTLPPPAGMYQLATPGYLQTMHIPLRAGRLLDARDGAEAPKTAVISERLAARFWPNEPLPLGKRFKVGPADSKAEWITIVGVVGDIMHSTFDRAPRPTLYVPYAQDPKLWMDIAVRTTGDPLQVAPAVTAAVRAVDPEQPVTYLRTMETLIHNQAVGLIYVAVLMGVFGALALALSCIGVYGVMAYLVLEQTHEIGVRMALGARRENVLGIIFRRGLVTTSLGLAVGLAMGYGLARLMQNLIFGVPTSDLVTFVGIPLALLVSAAVAILIPARRAMRIDPIVALRYE